jgi:hypothetical protein
MPFPASEGWHPIKLTRYQNFCPLDLGNTQANTSPVKLRALVSPLMLAVASIGAVRARLQQPVALPQLPESKVQLTPSEMEIYKRAHTLIDWTPRQIHDCPFLHKLRPAASQDQLPMVLERVGQTLTLLFHDFPQVACDEEIVSEAPAHARRGTFGRAMDRKFRYIVIPRPMGDFPAFEEYRTDLKGNPRDASSLGDLFMITSDFVSTGLYLSTANLPDNNFRHFGIQAIRNRKCHVVGFAQDPERVHTVSLFLFRGKAVALLVQGLAWIDSETFQLLRIKTWLLAPRADIGLIVLTSTVDFYPVQPSGFERVLWLPRDVTVVGDYGGNWFRNTHHYSNFKLFRVESTIKPAK